MKYRGCLVLFLSGCAGIATIAIFAYVLITGIQDLQKGALTVNGAGSQKAFLEPGNYVVFQELTGTSLASSSSIEVRSSDGTEVAVAANKDCRITLNNTKANSIAAFTIASAGDYQVKTGEELENAHVVIVKDFMARLMKLIFTDVAIFGIGFGLIFLFLVAGIIILVIDLKRGQGGNSILQR